MRKSEKQLPVRLIKGFHWVRNHDQVLILNSLLDERWILSGVEADIWDWLLQDIPFIKMVAMLTLLCGIDENHAHAIISRIMAKWKNANMVEEKIN